MWECVDKIEKMVKVKNRMGLHVRPASHIVKLLQKREAKVTLTYKGESVNARSIMGVMILAAPKNAQIHILVEGKDAKETMQSLVNAFKTYFGEEKHG